MAAPAQVCSAAAGGRAPSAPAAAAWKLVCQGAEARVLSGSFLGMPAVAKERFAKGYRHPDLDRRITSRRTVREARALARCRQVGIDTPAVFAVDLPRSRLVMERVAGRTVRDTLLATDLRLGESALAPLRPLAAAVGRAIARLHEAGIVHGDLTTSNMMVREGTGALVLIDFGLTQQSDLAEDHAVDLYVLERALVSTHPGSAPLFAAALAAYAAETPAAAAAARRLEDVRARGRRRSMVG